jgi:hypothetical protein
MGQHATTVEDAMRASGGRTGADFAATLDMLGYNDSDAVRGSGVSMQMLRWYKFESKTVGVRTIRRIWAWADAETEAHARSVERVMRTGVDEYEALHGRAPEVVSLVWLRRGEETADGRPVGYHNAVMRDAAAILRDNGQRVQFVYSADARSEDVR